MSALGDLAVVFLVMAAWGVALCLADLGFEAAEKLLRRSGTRRWW